MLGDSTITLHKQDIIVVCSLQLALDYLQHLQNYHCWMDQGDSNWFLGVPVILTIVLNVYFLTRVLIIQRAKLKYLFPSRTLKNPINF